jgi:hypothetical protein
MRMSHFSGRLSPPRNDDVRLDRPLQLHLELERQLADLVEESVPESACWNLPGRLATAP